jgi:signal-transduction protein with cAMP-binding, CBS, and nucleotidyltransferase domain
LERSSIVSALLGLAPSDHAVLFYSDIDMKRELVFPFIQEALEKHGLAVYVTEHEPFDELREAMKHWGIYVDKYEKDHSLTITDYETFTEAEERLSDLKTNQLLSHLLDLLVRRGVPVRMVSDATYVAKRGMIEKLVQRERALGRHLELPLTMICCYEDKLADLKDGEFLINTLQAHSHAVFPGIALRLA